MEVRSKSLPLSERRLGLAVAAISALVLIGAYTLSWLLDLWPCSLCMYQRWVYVGTFIIGVAAAVTHGGRGTAHALIALAAVGFAVGCGIAFFHTGVEHQWWTPGGVCEGALDGPLDIAQLQAQLQNLKPSPPCDEVQWRFLGLFSFAEMNTVMSLAFASLTAWNLALLRRR